MTYEQKKRIDHCAACIMMLAFALLLPLSSALRCVFSVLGSVM